MKTILTSVIFVCLSFLLYTCSSGDKSPKQNPGKDTLPIAQDSIIVAEKINNALSFSMKLYFSNKYDTSISFSDSSQLNNSFNALNFGTRKTINLFFNNRNPALGIRAVRILLVDLKYLMKEDRPSEDPPYNIHYTVSDMSGRTIDEKIPYTEVGSRNFDWNLTTITP